MEGGTEKTPKRVCKSLGSNSWYRGGSPLWPVVLFQVTPTLQRTSNPGTNVRAEANRAMSRCPDLLMLYMQSEHRYVAMCSPWIIARPSNAWSSPLFFVLTGMLTEWEGLGDKDKNRLEEHVRGRLQSCELTVFYDSQCTNQSLERQENALSVESWRELSTNSMPLVWGHSCLYTTQAQWAHMRCK